MFKGDAQDKQTVTQTETTSTQVARYVKYCCQYTVDRDTVHAKWYSAQFPLLDAVGVLLH